MENELKPGDINNYAWGYRDYLGIDGVKYVEPRMPDDEGYMTGWFAGKIYEVENKNRPRPRRPRGIVKIEDEWRKLAKEKGWPTRIPI